MIVDTLHVEALQQDHNEGKNRKYLKVSDSWFLGADRAHSILLKYQLKYVKNLIIYLSADIQRNMLTG